MRSMYYITVVFIGLSDGAKVDVYASHMTDLFAARVQMGLSLGFHIIFASISIVMPFFMAASHYRWLKHGSKVHLQLTKAWSKGVAIFFAVGAVSGTVLSFELGLLWPHFMEHAGPIIGMPFSWEGTAFFLEAIALGLFLYGWDRLRPWVHWWCGVMVGLCGIASAVFVVAANSWMNSPTGFKWENGKATNIDPVAAMFNPAFPYEALHMVLASFVATGFAVAGLHAYRLLRGHAQEFHKAAIEIVLPFTVVASLLQPLSGHLSAEDVAHRQPEKLAAMESLFHTQRRAPLLIGGIPSVEREEVNYGIELPALLSFLAFFDFNAEVKGLKEFPKEEWPPVLVVHFAFQIMVGIGTLLALVSALWLLMRWKKPALLNHRLFYKVLVPLIPLGFIAIEAGWTVTEVGRQPWIIYRVMKTTEAVTPMPGLTYSLLGICVIYFGLSLLLVWLMKKQIEVTERSVEGEA